MELKHNERKADGKYKKKQRDIFLLWGEYPKGWAMVKDMILCVVLINSLIGIVRSEEFAQAMQPEVKVFAQEHVLPVAKAAEVPKEEKTAPEARIEAKTGVFSAYNSEEAQTDSDPFTMASGKRVYDGAIANNCLAFGTKVKVGEKTYTVEDRMNSRYECDHFDIWMESYGEAISFGRKSIAYQVVEK